MKVKFYYLIMFALGLSHLQGQTMYLKQSNGTQVGFALNNLRKMTFSTGNLIVHKSDNSINVYALDNQRYLSFLSLTSNGFFNPSDNQLVMYPNPIIDVLNIDLSEEITQNANISILSLDGKILHKQHAESIGKLSINLSHLYKGMYLCRYANGKTIKTVKIIKQ